MRAIGEKKNVIDHATPFSSRRLHSREMRQVFFVGLTRNSYSQAYVRAYLEDSLLLYFPTTVLKLLSRMEETKFVAGLKREAR